MVVKWLLVAKVQYHKTQDIVDHLKNAHDHRPVATGGIRGSAPQFSVVLQILLG